MSELISVTVPDDGDPDDLFKTPEYPVLPAGEHLFAIGNGPLCVEVVESSGNDIIKLQAVCQDDDGNKGVMVFHNFVFIKNPTTEGQKKSIEINNAQLAQFVAACDVLTVAQIKAGEKFDLENFDENTFFRAKTTVKKEDTLEIGDDGRPVKAPKASFKQFLYDTETAATE